MKLRILVLGFCLIAIAGALARIGVWTQSVREKREIAERESRHLRAETAASEKIELAWNTLLQTANGISTETLQNLSSTHEVPEPLRSLAEAAFCVQNSQYRQIWNALPEKAKADFGANLFEDMAAASRFEPSLASNGVLSHILFDVETKRCRIVDVGAPAQTAGTFLQQTPARQIYGFAGFCHGGKVFLFRRLNAPDGSAWVQGFRLKKSALEAWLLSSVLKNFPATKLTFLSETGTTNAGGRKLFRLPATLAVAEEDVPEALSAKTVFSENPLLPAALLLIGAAGTLVVVTLVSIARTRRRERFVAAVSHELRSSCNTLCGISANLNDGDIPAKDFPKTFEMLDKAGLRLMHLFENVLAYSGLNGRRRPGASKEIISGERLAEHLELRGSERLRVAGMRLNLLLAENARFVLLKTDVIAVERIVMNLFENTCKYACVPGGKAELEVALRGKYLEIIVRDFGQGIDADTQARLFLDKVKKYRIGQHGLGLGLPLSRKIARALGGDLMLRENSSAGAAFLLRLPKI